MAGILDALFRVGAPAAAQYGRRKSAAEEIAREQQAAKAKLDAAAEEAKALATYREGQLQLDRDRIAREVSQRAAALADSQAARAATQARHEDNLGMQRERLRVQQARAGVPTANGNGRNTSPTPPRPPTSAVLQQQLAAEVGALVAAGMSPPKAMVQARLARGLPPGMDDYDVKEMEKLLGFAADSTATDALGRPNRRPSERPRGPRFGNVRASSTSTTRSGISLP